MKTKMRYIKENTIKKLSGILIPKFYLRALAEEPSSNTTPPKSDEKSPDSPTINYEDLIAKARKEEKDKLYPKITLLEGQISELTKKLNQHLITIGQKDVEIAELNKKLENTGKVDSEEVKTLNKKIKEMESELETTKKSITDVKALEEQIRAEYEVKLYREQKLGEVKDQVIPELVLGNTKEDIDKSIEASKKRYKEIFDSVSKNLTTIPPANPGSKFNATKFSIEDLNKLDPKSTEYKEFRKAIGLK